MKAPAFQLYAADFYMDTVGWSATEVGAYFRLLLHEWVNGPLPDDIMRLSRIAGIDHKTMGKFWLLSVGKKFIKTGIGTWENSRLEQTRLEQQKYIDSQSDKGKSGAEKRWHKEIAPAIAQPQPEDNSSSSSSSSSLKDLKDSVGKAQKRIAPQIDFDVEIEKVKQNFENGLKTGVESFILLTAEKNKTKKIAQSRELSILSQLSEVLTTVGTDKFKYGLYAALDNNVPNINYLKKAAQNSKKSNDEGWRE